MNNLRPSSTRHSALKTLADISKIVTSSHDAEETLALTAKMIAERMDVEVCSIYVYDAKDEFLVLRATHGLNKSSIGQIKMSPSEGLVGLVLEIGETVQAAEMKRHPRFKYFPQSNEDLYSSFLGVPLIEHRKCFGVLVVHTIECRNFDEEEEQLLVTIASQIAGVVSQAILIQQLDDLPIVQDPIHASSMRLTGTAMASGIALGRAVLLENDAMEEPDPNPHHTFEIEYELFKKASEQTITDILELIERVSGVVSSDEAAIFHAHLMFLEDHSFQEKIESNIRKGHSATWSIYQVVQDYLRAFEEIDDPYLRERGEDLKDVGYRLLHHLGYGQLASVDTEGILITKQLLPADVAHLNPEKIKGIITSTGGALSHAAILARSLLIPAVCIPDRQIEEIKDGDFIALDGQSGYVVINPAPQILSEFQRLLVGQEQYFHHLEEFRDLPCQTADGEQVITLANVGLIGDTNHLTHYGAQGVGLYRTEVYFLSLDRYPTIEEQCEVYSQVIRNVSPDFPVVFRTLDIGSDKSAPYMGLLTEENPYLGRRAIRQHRHHPEILKNQMLAILKAAIGTKNVQLLFPMVSQVSEMRFAKSLYEECRRELLQAGEEPPDLPIGMMFEVPAAVLMADRYVDLVDFFSIGSNDLTQYTLAVDRNNPTIADMYDPLNPAVLEMIKHLVNFADKFQKPLELCGEMASDPDGCVILVGLGLKQLSMNASLIPVVKERLSKITLLETQQLSLAALKAESAEHVRRLIWNFFENLNKRS